MKALADKPKSKWQSIAHVWDRAIVVNLGGLITVTAFITNNAGILLLIIWGGVILFFGLYVASRRK